MLEDLAESLLIILRIGYRHILEHVGRPLPDQQDLACFSLTCAWDD